MRICVNDEREDYQQVLEEDHSWQWPHSNILQTKIGWVSSWVQSTRCQDMSTGRLYLDPGTTRSKDLSTQPPNKIRLCFPDATTSWNKVFLSFDMHVRISVCTTKERFYEDHTMLEVILCTVWQSFPYQLFFQCWDPYDFLHWIFHTDTVCHNKTHSG